MESTPDHERPVRPVPQPAQEHGEGQVDPGPARPPATAAKRDVDVVPEPGREGDVPPAPEVGEAHGRVGRAEVVGQGEAEAHGQSHRTGHLVRTRCALFD